MLYTRVHTAFAYSGAQAFDKYMQLRAQLAKHADCKCKPCADRGWC